MPSSQTKERKLTLRLALYWTYNSFSKLVYGKNVVLLQKPSLTRSGRMIRLEDCISASLGLSKLSSTLTVVIKSWTLKISSSKLKEWMTPFTCMIRFYLRSNNWQTLNNRFWKLKKNRGKSWSCSAKKCWINMNFK